MGYTKSVDTVMVRRRGGFDKFTVKDEDGGDRITNSGDRRSRQIGKRHWVIKVNDYFNSHGSDHLGISATTRSPGKEAQKHPLSQRLSSESYEEVAQRYLSERVAKITGK